MPTELVLLTAAAPTDADIISAAAHVDPSAAYLDWAHGTVRQVLDTTGQPLIQVFASRLVHDTRHAAAIAAVPPGWHGCWTDLTVPRHSDPGPGLAIAAALARTTDGTLAARS